MIVSGVSATGKQSRNGAAARRDRRGSLGPLLPATCHPSAGVFVPRLQPEQQLPAVILRAHPGVRVCRPDALHAVHASGALPVEEQAAGRGVELGNNTVALLRLADALCSVVRLADTAVTCPVSGHLRTTCRRTSTTSCVTWRSGPRQTSSGLTSSRRRSLLTC